MIVGINCGHTISGPGAGAVGYFSESEHTRHVGYALMDKFVTAGVQVVDCTINYADTQADYLKRAVEKANNQDLDWFISIHFNASPKHMGHGVEVYTYEGRQYPDALAVCNNMEKLGFKNRGVKVGSGLYAIRKTKAKSMLIEVCFCDNQEDASTYVSATLEKVVNAIYTALYKYVIDKDETSILGKSIATAEQLKAYMLMRNYQAVSYTHLPQLFIEEGDKEGIRGDGAFIQSCKETGFFKFGGDVKPGQHNYAGLGATGGVPGLSFPDDRTGVRAQIQHLKAYASTEPLVMKCVDPRYKYVNKGCAPTWEQLSGKWAVPGYSGYNNFADAWAAKDTYGHHIVKMLKEALQTVSIPEQKKQEYIYSVSIADVWTQAEADAIALCHPGSKVHKITV
ncbi:N-acetylmuramoyl-L-alanine amidase [Eisenbergiella porci]|uniref:N-acetylmuramoyl-L-alanine amidase n=1 Tax=Eisenbergiella porci TaxID=2652274 RepID=UPI002A83421F|nr:N-acetylmuramoyl-L-alanine amidase [Eisenbergiella porci]